MLTRHSALRGCATLLGWGILACAVAPAAADETIKSLDGKVELTVRDDGSIDAVNKDTNTQWQFPPKDSTIAKAKNYQTAFAPKDTNLPKSYGRAVYVAYGNQLYCINGDDGKFLWINRFADQAPPKASFQFQGQQIVLSFDGETQTFDVLTGKKLK
jgi:outer membrane protein assembly factor BamB